MNTTNSNMPRFWILKTLLLTTLFACGGPEAESPDDFQTQSSEQVDDRSKVIDSGNVPEEVHPEDSYNALAYNGACGSGYGVIDSHAVAGGTVYLTYNSSTGKNCVVTVRNSPGNRVQMCAKVSRAGAAWVQDCGSYTTYAGPVYVAAPNACIDWGGSIGGSPYHEYNTHCG
ncbi:spore-associated protein A [Stigmatella sp. ncwal1]|uniref:Spore-associated protein A n=1 Tax=Stigmatella ashevillensis TaxID=2995309 RepID=A0ABT5DBX8_9BACT|nr:spore-associated protein A [Stigmatella ashevillena]MDC0710559.1 spore-associated protein A [Stigmatella ashevillena]